MKLKKEDEEAITRSILEFITGKLKAFNPNITIAEQNKALSDIRQILRGENFKQESQIPLRMINQWVNQAKEVIAQKVEESIRQIVDDDERAIAKGNLTRQLMTALERDICLNSARRTTKAMKGLLAAGAGTILVWAAYNLLKDGQDPKEAVEEARDQRKGGGTS